MKHTHARIRTCVTTGLNCTLLQFAYDVFFLIFLGCAFRCHLPCAEKVKCGLQRVSGGAGVSGAVAAETRVSNNHGNGSGGDSHSDSGHRKRQTSNQLAGTHYRRGRELLFCPLIPAPPRETGGSKRRTGTKKGGEIWEDED